MTDPTETYSLPVPGALESEIKVSAGSFPSGGVEGRLCSVLSPWLSEGRLLSASLHVVFPVGVSVQISPFYKDLFISPIGLGPTLLTSF